MMGLLHFKHHGPSTNTRRHEGAGEVEEGRGEKGEVGDVRRGEGEEKRPGYNPPETTH